MNICIVGLGIIGASYAIGLMKKGHKVYGIDKDSKTIDYALKHNYIVDGYTDDFKILSKCDLIILAIYPQSIINFLNENNSYFHSGQIITDVCGIKSSFIKKATILAKDAYYLSHHPMAGKEKIGIEYADSNIFKGANFLITPIDDFVNEAAVKCLNKIALDLEFGKVSVVDYKKHDKMIAFTSQLTHAIAVSLVNSDSDSDTINFIGDSYRDLTRIAMINEKLWAELFLENKEALLNHISNFEKQLDILKSSLINNDKDKLNELFKNSTIIRKKMEK